MADILTLELRTGKKTRIITGQFIEDRLPAELPGYPYRYAIRGERRNDPGEFCSLEKYVLINFCGHFFTTLPIEIDGCVPIKDWNFGGMW